MNYITYKDYHKYNKNNTSENTKEEIYDEKEVRRIDKKHDKTIKIILKIKKEMSELLNQFLELKIEEENLIECSTEFITKKYKEKRSDIIYRIKNKPVYFLVEHQSTINKDMIERIGEYTEEIMRKAVKDGKYPIVVPIVIYTGYQKWNAKTNFREKKYQSKEYKEYAINLKYNLIAIQNYSYEELKEKKTLLASVMIIEKCKKGDELYEKLIEIIKITKEEDKKVLREIIDKVIAPEIGEEKTKELLEKIKEKEEIGMSPLTKMFLDSRYQGRREGREEGRRFGRKEGQEGKTKEIVQKMLKYKEPENKIIEYTGISKKELNVIKSNI